MAEMFDYDGFYKDLIDRFLYQLLKRAIPELYEKADITKAPALLDKEFRDILNTGDRTIRKSPHFADLVFKVPLLDGNDAWILFHVEAQHGTGGGNIAERMFHYACLIFAHYRKNPVALAIITQGRRKEERFYCHSHFGTKSVYEYNNLVLAELDDEELKASDNPIDLALYAAKCALKARTGASTREELQKFNYLYALLDLLAERGWSREDKRDLLLFLERIIDLQDKELEKRYIEHRTQLNKEAKIVYIPLGERELAKQLKDEGKAEGMEQGMAKGKEEMARSLLANGISPDIIAQSAGLPVEQIRALIN